MGAGKREGRATRPSFRLPADLALRFAPRLRSTIGRPRVLTYRQVRRVLAAYARYCAWKALRRTVKSQRQLAQEFRVSLTTIQRVIRSQGRFKQAPPEQRTTELRRRRWYFARLRAKGLL